MRNLGSWCSSRRLTNNLTHRYEDYPMCDRSNIRCETIVMTDNRSRRRGSERGGGRVVRVGSRREQSGERARGNWRSHVRRRATPGARNERGNRYCVDGGTVDTGSRSKNHESEESTNCCAETYRQGQEVKAEDPGR